MENLETTCEAGEIIKCETEITSSVMASLPSNSHLPLKMEELLERIFCCLDVSSLKNCRLTCSSWTVTATYFLMRKTFFNVPLQATVTEELFHRMNLFKCVKISGDLLPRLSLTTPNFSSFKVNWKSVFVSFEPSPSGLFSLTSFLAFISSGQCPQVSHIKIYFDSSKSIATAKNIAITTPILIQSLHLSFDASTNVPGVSGFLQVLLQKEVVPNLKELVVTFPDVPGWTGIRKFLMTPRPIREKYKNLIETLEGSDEVLGSLRILKIQGNVSFGMKFSHVLHFSPDNARKRCAPITLGVTSELKQLQLGYGLIQDSVELSNFLPGILTPNVASVLQSLDLSGIYSNIQSKESLKVTFPEMPCLRKLSVEEVTLFWITNFPTIFIKAKNIREFRVKDSFADIVVNRDLTLEDELRIQQWEDKWKHGKYPSLRLLELCDSMYVAKFGFSLRKLGGIFPNVEVLQFGFDEDLGSIRHKDPGFRFKALPEIVEGLEGWKFLKHLKLTYFSLYSVEEILEHFLDCAAKFTSLRLCDFHWRDYFISSFREEKFLSDSSLDQLKKMLRLKSFPGLLFVIDNFHCLHEGCGKEDVVRGKCSVMKELLEFADKAGIYNFREAVD